MPPAGARNLATACRVIRCRDVCGQPDEAEIVARAQAGDREAFASLIRAYQQPLGGYLWRLTGDREVAQDLTQETFLRAYQGIGATRPGLRVRGWLYRIATNLAYDLLRRRRRVGFVPLWPAEGPPWWEDPATIGEADAVWRALAQLTPNERAALLLCALEGYSYREAAEIVRASPEAVRKQFERAKDHFRRAYSGQTDAADWEPRRKMTSGEPVGCSVAVLAGSPVPVGIATQTLVSPEVVHPSGELLEAAAFGWISEAEAEPIRQHARGCERCAARLALDEQVRLRLASVERHAPRISAVEGVLSRVNHQVLSVGPLQLPPMRSAVIAVVVAGAAVSGWVFGGRGRSKTVRLRR